MRGPPPKDPRLLTGHRRNRATTKATLPTEAEAAKREIPSLPPRKGKGKWHPDVVVWWESIWTSPMAAEYVEADRHGLHMLAKLHQMFLTASNKDSVKYATEIRQQEARFGLSPVDRRRLQWEVERGDVASQRTETRRQRKRPNPKKDPREVLRLEK